MSKVKSNKQLWKDTGYNGGSAFSGGQMKLASKDKIPLVTPRASSSASSSKQSKSTAKQPSVIASFARQRRAAAGSPRTAVQPSKKGKGKENRPPLKERASTSTSEHDDDTSVAPEKEEPAGVFSLWGGLFNRKSTKEDTSPSTGPSAGQQSQPRPSKGLGKRIVKPSADERRQGPTLDFDDSQELPADDNEMVGETQRRKRKRVQEGGKGQLDLVPADDHEGFGGRTQASGSSRKRVKRELELERASQQKMEIVEDSEEEQQQEDRWEDEPETAQESFFEEQPPSSQHPTRSYAESSEGDDEYLQQQLVPRRDDTSFVLVPDSDDLIPQTDEAEVLPMSSGDAAAEGGLGAGMADDSGFAEMDDETEEPKHDSALGILPPHLTSSYSKRPPKTLPSPVEANTTMDQDPVPDTQQPFPSLVADHTLVRTPSGILMPPPPLPRTRSSPTSVKSSSSKKLLAEKTPSPPEPEATPPTDSPQSSPVVLVPDTQPRDTSISPRRPLSAKHLGPVVCEETQAALSPSRRRSISPPPVASTSKLAPFSPRRHITSTWDSLASAWAGARPPSPPKPPSPRQSRLNEFFNIPPLSAVNDDDETQIVEDSQPTCTNLTLEQAAAFHRALQTTREMGRVGSHRSLGSVPEEAEEEDIEEAQDVNMVTTSDAEEEPWSPLGSPTKLRFPSLVRGNSQGRQGSQSQAKRRQASQQGPSSSQQRSADQLAQLETQWESYWSEETYQPFVPLAE